MSSSKYIFAFTLTLLAGCGGSREVRSKAETTATAPIAVRAVTVAASEWPSGSEATGTVRARATGVVSSKVMGYVREVRVHVGDTVRAGQLLVVLDDRDLDAGFRQAEAARREAGDSVSEADNGIAAAQAQLELAQATFRRMRDLHTRKSISHQEFDEASAKLKLATAAHRMALSKRQQLDARIGQADQAVAAARISKSYSELRAPFSGTIVEKQVEPGNLAAPGTPLLIIEQAGAYRLETSLEESMLGNVRRGEPATVEIDALDKTVTGHVSEIVPAVESSSRAFLVKIDLPAIPGLRSGVFARARFAGSPRSALAIPKEAVIEQGQVRSVFIVDNGIARGRLISTGQRRGDFLEVLSGLTAGDRLITPVPPALTDGARVEVRP